MCFAIPMRLCSIDGMRGICEAKGVEREVNLIMLQDEAIAIGDFVTVHLGYALEKISEDDAQITWQLYDDMLERLTESKSIADRMDD